MKLSRCIKRKFRTARDHLLQPSSSNTVREVSRHQDISERPGSDFITEALQGMLLIPRTPSPPGSPTPVPLEERPIDDLTPEEMRELLKRHQVISLSE